VSLVKTKNGHLEGRCSVDMPLDTSDYYDRGETIQLALGIRGALSKDEGSHIAYGTASLWTRQGECMKVEGEIQLCHAYKAQKHRIRVELWMYSQSVGRYRLDDATLFIPEQALVEELELVLRPLLKRGKAVVVTKNGV
jgi:hypothetical protein